VQRTERKAVDQKTEIRRENSDRRGNHSSPWERTKKKGPMVLFKVINRYFSVSLLLSSP